ncbi:FadR/GntR family transcriptional regulator [Vineibacter terrae]|uniref:FadR/GntR family transcriptional regulator n=1 Tax=Vineibacter terrae TaxID=2586908 RepID=UPI002E3745EF|nr:FadR/GntR family transcriptional regulator [Vineibacter terrae]HEX2886023.1 FadR/GntR family transcriptional regulator [Vineibacter terrae]
MSSPQPRSSAFRPLAPPRNLTRTLIERLSAEILDGTLAPGAKLPTEPEMMAALGVSRTVIREAVAALRAEGLVVTRQGVGAFVASDVRRRPFRIDPDGLQSIGEVLNVMELRTGVEVEAAGLAAERATPESLRRIERALAAIDRAVAQDEAAVDEDYAFHRAIADATGNPQFARFHEFLGRFVIPRQSVRAARGHMANPRAYLEMIQGEHRAILEGIRERQPPAARRAMRRHLENSRKRYRRLAAEG